MTIAAICIAVDAGPFKWGCATVRIDGARLVLVEGSHRVVDPAVPESRAWVTQRVAEVRDAGGAVVAEWTRGGAFENARVVALIETARAEGGLQWLALTMGARHEHYAAADVRRDLVLDGQASDERIAVVVEWMYGDAVRSRIPDPAQRPHVYDAMLLAAWWLLREQHRSITLPGAVVARLLAMRAAERAATADRREGKRAAAPVATLLEACARAHVVPTLAVLLTKVAMPKDAVVAALWVVARGRSEAAKAARAILKAAALPATDPAKRRSGTRVQRAARKTAAQQGWQRRGKGRAR